MTETESIPVHVLENNKDDPKSNNDKNGTETEQVARRPMNAFLIFCKKHRSVVKKTYPNSENR